MYTLHDGLQAPEPGKEDVREHLQQLRRQVLAGVQLVFSHVIPLEQDMTQHPLWQLATQVRLCKVVQTLVYVWPGLSACWLLDLEHLACFSWQPLES